MATQQNEGDGGGGGGRLRLDTAYTIVYNLFTKWDPLFLHQKRYLFLEVPSDNFKSHDEWEVVIVFFWVLGAVLMGHVKLFIITTFLRYDLFRNK